MSHTLAVSTLLIFVGSPGLAFADLLPRDPSLRQFDGESLGFATPTLLSSGVALRHRAVSSE